MILEAFFWMVINTHYEARGESPIGRVAINHVVINRAYSSKTKEENKIKYEILKPKAFSWTNNKENKKNAYRLEKEFLTAIKNFDIIKLRKFKKYKNSMIAVISSMILQDTTNGSNHYYNPKLASPKWAKSGYQKTIGNHDFHRLSYGKNQIHYAVLNLSNCIKVNGYDACQ